MRDCNKCVYSTRDGNCRKFDCNGTVTVEDIRKDEKAKVVDQAIEILRTNVLISAMGKIERLKEQK